VGDGLDCTKVYLGWEEIIVCAVASREYAPVYSNADKRDAYRRKGKSEPPTKHSIAPSPQSQLYRHMDTAMGFVSSQRLCDAT